MKSDARRTGKSETSEEQRVTTEQTTEQGYDVIVLGAGPAGLQATLTLGRMHRPTLVLDAGTYRNDPADAMHNVVGFDGATPAEFRAAAHRDLAAYADVTVRRTAATTVEGDLEEGFRVDLADGTTAWARRVLLATGVRDTLPAIEGLDELWGSVAAHCPFCHGHEYAGTHVALIGPHAPMLSLMVDRIAARRTVLTDGAPVPDGTAELAERTGLGVRTEPITRLERTATGARAHFESGPVVELGGILVGTTLAQAAPFAEQLGLTLLESGCVEVDPFGHTSLPGVSAAGDMAHTRELPMPAAAVLAAAASGLMAATALVRELAFEDGGL
jgi:thioredoxin reductase